MEMIERSIDLNVPVQTAYQQWTRFEEFPRFMEGVEEVRQLDARRLHWVPEFGGERMSAMRRASSSTRRSVSPGATPTARTTPAS